MRIRILVWKPFSTTILFYFFLHVVSVCSFLSSLQREKKLNVYPRSNSYVGFRCVMESIELEKNNERKYTFSVTNRHGACSIYVK